MLDDRTQDKAVKLVLDSITLNDCVMRGEIHNHSNDLYARDVTITVAALDSENSVEWHWPLTIMPGETAPFEVEISWFPHVYSHENPAGSMQYLLNAENWKVFGNTSFDITAELSLTPDIGRAFSVNSDGTEHIVLYQNPYHKFLVYDERALELEESKDWYRYGREYSPITRHSFDLVFPERLVIGKDIEPIVSEFNLYQFTDIYYTPSWLYPEVYEEDTHDLVSDVRVYQAYKSGNKIVDVWELIPHLVVEQEDSHGLLIDRQFIAKSDFINYDLSPGEDTYIQLLDPYYNHSNFPHRNSGGGTLSSFAVSLFEQNFLWIGGVSHREISSIGDPSTTLPRSNGVSCFSSGALFSGDFNLIGQMAHQYIDNLGNYGILSTMGPDDIVPDEVYVDDNSVTVVNHTIRGLLFNGSERSYARDVRVEAIHKETGMLLGMWHWPLSMQPSESAPFEIKHFESDLSFEEIQFEVSAALSDQPDPTRSFLVKSYAGGRVYGERFMDLYNYRPYDSEYYEVEADYFLDQRAIHYGGRRSRYTKEEFLELYDGVLTMEDVEGLELFGFHDMYARLEPPDSHPELAKVITNQFIEGLRAFSALLDSEMRIVEVVELKPFTPVYGHSNMDKPYVTVDRIPAPNHWSPNAVRLLQITPYEDEADMDIGYYHLAWIGGASEPVG